MLELEALGTLLSAETQPLQLDEIRLQTDRIEAELRQPVRPIPSNDAGNVLLNQARQSLDSLERELSRSKQ